MDVVEHHDDGLLASEPFQEPADRPEDLRCRAGAGLRADRTTEMTQDKFLFACCDSRADARFSAAKVPHNFGDGRIRDALAVLEAVAA
jgi:hypothetical protein